MEQPSKEHFFLSSLVRKKLFAFIDPLCLTVCLRLLRPTSLGGACALRGIFCTPLKDIFSIKGFSKKSSVEKRISLGQSYFHDHFPQRDNFMRGQRLEKLSFGCVKRNKAVLNVCFAQKRSAPDTDKH